MHLWSIMKFFGLEVDVNLEANMIQSEDSFLVGAFLVKSAQHLQWLVFFFFFRQTTISLWLGHFSYNRNY